MYVGSILELPVSLTDTNGQIKKGVHTPFQIFMQRKDDPTSIFSDSIEVLNPDALMVNENTGETLVRIELLTTSNLKNMILIIAPSDNSQTNIAWSSTGSFQVVTSRLEVTNENLIKSTFYKDEGGCDNQIELIVRAVNSAFEADLTKVGMQLRCVLRYENGELAFPRQVNEKSDEPLFTLCSDTLFLDEAACCSIKCRIGQISSNHNKRNFKVWVEPVPYQSSRQNLDTSPTSSPAIKVKTKISASDRKARGLPPPTRAKRAKPAVQSDSDAVIRDLKRQRTQLKGELKEQKQLVQAQQVEIEALREAKNELERLLSQRKSLEDMHMVLLQPRALDDFQMQAAGNDAAAEFPAHPFPQMISVEHRDEAMAARVGDGCVPPKRENTWDLIDRFYNNK